MCLSWSAENFRLLLALSLPAVSKCVLTVSSTPRKRADRLPCTEFLTRCAQRITQMARSSWQFIPVRFSGLIRPGLWSSSSSRMAPQSRRSLRQLVNVLACHQESRLRMCASSCKHLNSSDSYTSLSQADVIERRLARMRLGTIRNRRKEEECST